MAWTPYAAIQLTSDIATRLQRPVPDALLLHYPSVAQLSVFMRLPDTTQAGTIAVDDARRTQLQSMLADSSLPENIQPPAETSPSPAKILLTGATGFLGAYILRALLRDTSADVVCLVRPGEQQADDRLKSNLTRYGLWDANHEPRLKVVAGDLRAPQLGLSDSDHRFLAETLDVIYHCGANVNWTLSYDGLRDSNVIGTRELLRLACLERAKPFGFVSSIATCYTSSPAQQLSEQHQALSGLRDIHLGYAQSKCVAEALVVEAGRRGLPAMIFRPALITGDSVTGHCNSEDLLSTMMRGCIAMGAAPDLDWSLDCCPVDYVADAVVALSTHRQHPLNILHVVNPQKCHWREIVLWMNLWGYPVRLQSYRHWLAGLRTAASRPSHPLYRLRSFFFARPLSAGGQLSLPELYEDHRRSRVNSAASQQQLTDLSIACPAPDANLLSLYFESYVADGLLPQVSRRRSPRAVPQTAIQIAAESSAKTAAGASFDAAFFQDILRRHEADDTLRVHTVSKQPLVSQAGITSDLAEVYSTRGTGLYSVQLGWRGRSGERSLRLCLKAKAAGEDVQAVAQCVANACDARVGQAMAQHARRLESVDSHQRELNIYRQSDPRVRRHVPHVYANLADDRQRQWVLALEWLSDLELFDSADKIDDWQPRHLAAAIEGLAQLHSVWYQRQPELVAQGFPVSQRTTNDMLEMRDLWSALADFSWTYYSAWIDADARSTISRWVEHLEQWWPILEGMPQTLIHNDFNPRNIAFRSELGTLRLCAYDWELATIGAAQHDLAELLCFVLTRDTPRDQVLKLLDMHREFLSTACGCSIDARSWQTGFQLSLRYLMINRFAMYSLLHRFRRQAYLPRVIDTCWWLHGVLEEKPS